MNVPRFRPGFFRVGVVPDQSVICPRWQAGGRESLPLKLRIWHWAYCRWYDADRAGWSRRATLWGHIADGLVS